MEPLARAVRKSSGLNIADFQVCHAESGMRDPEIIETELMEMSAIADDTIKFERIVAWCASHPDEIPFALHQLMGRPKEIVRTALSSGSPCLRALGQSRGKHQ